MFQNRPLLCGYIAGKEGNRVDYGMSDAVSVWNGESASFAGAALYFGGSEELTAFAQVYNRFGASIYIAGIFTKMPRPMSSSAATPIPTKSISYPIPSDARPH